MERSDSPRGAGGVVAIIGMACLFPRAPDLRTYWHNIVSKVDAVTDPPPEAWEAAVFYDPGSTTNDRVYCKRGGFISPLAYFDPLQHGVMPRTVEGGEPDQWLVLQVARAALADAGYGDLIPERERTAVIIGKGTYLNRGNLTAAQHGIVTDQTLEILKTLHPEFTEADLQFIRKELKQRLPPFNADTAPGLIPNITAGRIANRLDLMGPSFTVDAACASSLIAIDIAARDLLTGRCDLALVGGSHVVTPVPVLMLFCQLGALSRRQQIRPFDKDADGTILAEGIGMVVLKRLEDARRDGNRIYAVIKGVGTSSDGRGMSVMAPRMEGEVEALRRAYEAAGVAPRTVGLIEAHGTGTPVGDATEVRALTQVFGPRDGALPGTALGSVKSMIGHTMPAAGIAGVIKIALALYHKTLPPTLNVDEPDPELHLEATPFYINTDTRPWVHGSDDAPRRAGVSAFGFGGINAHVVLEEAPDADPASFQSSYTTWDTEVFLFDAPSRLALQEQTQRIRRLLDGRLDVELKDLAYTINSGYGQTEHRLAVVAGTAEDLRGKLDRALERLADPACHRIKDVQGIYFTDPSARVPGRLAFLFPGEGGQYVNMLADLCLHFPEVRQHFDRIDRVFAGHPRSYLPSDLIFPRPTFSAAERQAVEARIWQADGAVEAVLTANQALFALLAHLGIRPDAVVGHSTGEYSAMLASGMIDLADGVRLDEFAQELNAIFRQVMAEGEISAVTLAAVGADHRTVSTVLQEDGQAAYIAMDNCPHQTVIAGTQAAVERSVARLRERGVICERLPFNRPYHTPLFDTYAERLRPFLARWIVSAPRIKTYSCTITSPFSADVSHNRQVALEHWLRPVEFRKTIEAMSTDGYGVFVEVGAGGNLSAFVDDILRNQPHVAMAANIKSRSGITQLNHLVGLLAAQGIPVKPDHLYAHRSPRKLDPEQAATGQTEGRKTPSQMKLATGWPLMSLSTEAAARLRSQAQAPTHHAPPPVSDGGSGAQALTDLAAKTHGKGVHGDDFSRPVPQKAAVRPGDQAGEGVSTNLPVFAPKSGLGPLAVPPTTAAQVMAAHFRTMEQFLAVQQEVMQAFLAGQALAPSPASLEAQPVVKMGLPTDGAATQQEAAAPAPPGAATDSAVAALAGDATPPALPAQPQPAEPGQVENALLGADAIREVLLQLVSERTGYPIEMLNLDLDLEADLGIDSIKRIEILGSFRKRTGLLRTEDMEGLAGRKTLRAVLDFLAGAAVRSAGHSANGPDANPGAAQHVIGDASLPLALIGTVLSLTPGQELVARLDLDGDRHLFLRDHTLGREISMTDPELRGLPIMPLTFSMEMLAEGAALLMPGQQVIGMRDVRAHRWIALERDRLSLELVAKHSPDGPANEVHAYLREGGLAEEAQATPIIEGIVVCAADYPQAPQAGEFGLASASASRWAPEVLYREGMFHGPAFRGVRSIDRTAEDGAEATVAVLPADGLLSGDSTPAFVTDPVLLDQPGQVVGFWTAEHLPAAFVIFPFSLRELRLYGPRPEVGVTYQCRAHVGLVGERGVRSDLDLVGHDGRVWARFVAWEDRRFDVQEAFYRFLLSPRSAVLSQPWESPMGAQSDFVTYGVPTNAFPEGFLAAHGGIWQRVLAHLILSRRERALWHDLRAPEIRRIEWLLGRMAAKDAARAYLKTTYELDLCPADIEIIPDEHGRPQIQGSWIDRVPRVPLVSLSHSGGTAVAMAGSDGRAAGLGVDIERVGHFGEEAARMAFTPTEQALLSSLKDVEMEAWPLRFWCAKEAVAKALGQGMIGGPQAVVVRQVDRGNGTVYVSLAGELGRRIAAQETISHHDLPGLVARSDSRSGLADATSVAPTSERIPRTITAHTARKGDLVIAAAVLELQDQRAEIGTTA